MFFHGLNFSHYDVIYKAMNSNMGRFINEVYIKNGEKVNNILRKRMLNAEEYQVALTGVAYIGNGQLNPIYLEKLCAADGSGAMAMRNKLQKYLEMTANDRNKEVKTDNGVKAEKPKKDILNWYCDCLIKSRNSFSDLRTENGPSPIVYITLNSGVNLCIYRNSDNNKHSVVIQSVDFGDKVKCERIEFNLSIRLGEESSAFLISLIIFSGDAELDLFDLLKLNLFFVSGIRRIFIKRIFRYTLSSSS